MKLCTAIASLLGMSACWADPTVEWTTLRHDKVNQTSFCQVEAYDLQDLHLTENAYAYACMYSQGELAWIVYLGRISPQTERMGTMTHAPTQEVEGWDQVEIVIVPLDDVAFAYQPCDYRPAEKFRTPIPHPRDDTHFNWATPNPHYRAIEEAQDARAEELTADKCIHRPAPEFKPPAHRPCDADGTFRTLNPKGYREACEAKNARADVDTRSCC